MTPSVESVASEFSQALRALLTPEQMALVLARNFAESRPSICHTHDFCDANVVLHDVFLANGMDPADEGGMEKWGSLWDAAWNLAKSREFRVL